MLLQTILGGLTGILGNVITSITNYKTQKLKNSHEIAMNDFKLKEIVAKTDANIKLTTAKVQGALELEDAKIYKVAQEKGNQRSFSDKWIDKLLGLDGKLRFISVPFGVLIATMFGFLDFLKGLMRPGLTLYLTGVTSWITWMAWQIMQKDGITMTSAEAIAIFTEVTSIVVYLTVSCVTWWFGDRRIAKFLAKLNDDRSAKIVNINSSSKPKRVMGTKPIK